MSRILVVDDELVFCELLKTLLRSQGNEVLTACNGREALDLFKQHRPQFTLLDLRMPEMNGIEVLRQIRAIDPQATVMILTAWGSDELEQQARQLGAIDFLSKTFSLDTIVGSLERALKPPGQAPAAEKTVPPGIPETDTILLVGEKPKTRDLFRQFLVQHGFHVKGAPDGPMALKLLDQERPQLIVLDMDMPDMEGIEVLRTLRAKNYKGGIIMLTNSQDGRLLKEAPTLGAVDLLGKPVDPERLMLAIQVGLVLLKI